jgi:hypothetical protein
MENIRNERLSPACHRVNIQVPRRSRKTIVPAWDAPDACKEPAMNIRLNTTPVCLAKSQAVTLTDAKGSQIRCLSGGLWITQDRDPRDVVLQAGESFTLDRAGPAIVWAFAQSSVEVRAPQPPRRFAAIARRWGELAPRHRSPRCSDVRELAAGVR